MSHNSVIIRSNSIRYSAEWVDNPALFSSTPLSIWWRLLFSPRPHLSRRVHARYRGWKRCGDDFYSPSTIAPRSRAIAQSFLVPFHPTCQHVMNANITKAVCPPPTPRGRLCVLYGPLIYHVYPVWPLFHVCSHASFKVELYCTRLFVKACVDELWLRQSRVDFKNGAKFFFFR